VAYVVVDTDVASQILRDRLPPPLAMRLTGNTLCATFVTVAELTQWLLSCGRSDADRRGGDQMIVTLASRSVGTRGCSGQAVCVMDCLA
jgi:hypothetical protein